MTRLSSPALAVLGLLGVGLLAERLFVGAITVGQAGARGGVLLGVLLLLDRLLLPLARTLVGPAQESAPVD